MVDIALNSSLNDLKNTTNSYAQKNSTFSNVMGSMANYFNNRSDNNSVLNSATTLGSPPARYAVLPGKRAPNA